MKHLTDFDDLYTAQTTSNRLRASGVLTHVSNEHSRTHSFITGAFSVGLWVILDEQYNDAIGLLNNKQHVVDTPLSEDEMTTLELEAKTNFNHELKTGILANIFIIPTLLALIAIGVYIKSVW